MKNINLCYSYAGLPKTLNILDTAGTSQFSSLHDLYIKNGDGFLIVYNLANKQSFNDIRNMRETILRIKGLPSNGFVPLVLVGTKADLLSELDDKSCILREPINLANEWLCPHVETSARDNIGVEDVFLELLSQVRIFHLSDLIFLIILLFYFTVYDQLYSRSVFTRNFCLKAV